MSKAYKWRRDSLNQRSSSRVSEIHRSADGYEMMTAQLEGSAGGANAPSQHFHCGERLDNT